MINPPQLFRSTSARLLLALAVIVLAIGSGIAIASALKDDKPAPAESSNGVNARSLGIAVQGLCEVRGALESNRMDAARTAFYDKAHLFLHQLAAATEEKDRDLATTLLIAKYRVEDLLPASGQPPAATPSAGVSPPDLVTQLLQQVDASATTLGLSAPSCQS